MPFYDFKCPNDECLDYNVKKEFFIKPQEYDKVSEELKCPICNSKLVRVYNGRTGLKFNGNGFYVNDYK